MNSKVTSEQLEAQVANTERELEEAQAQLRAALTELPQLRRALDDLESRRKNLAPAAYKEDPAAVRETEDIEGEIQRCNRRLRLLEDAVPALEACVEEARERYPAAVEATWRYQDQQLLDKQRELEEQRDELAAKLKETLNELEDLSMTRAQLVRQFDLQQANAIAQSIQMGGTRKWLVEEAFYAWLKEYSRRIHG